MYSHTFLLWFCLLTACCHTLYTLSPAYTYIILFYILLYTTHACSSAYIGSSLLFLVLAPTAPARTAFFLHAPPATTPAHLVALYAFSCIPPFYLRGTPLSFPAASMLRILCLPAYTHLHRRCTCHCTALTLHCGAPPPYGLVRDYLFLLSSFPALLPHICLLFLLLFACTYLSTHCTSFAALGSNAATTAAPPRHCAVRRLLRHAPALRRHMGCRTCFCLPTLVSCSSACAHCKPRITT